MAVQQSSSKLLLNTVSTFAFALKHRAKLEIFLSPLTNYIRQANIQPAPFFAA